VLPVSLSNPSCLSNCRTLDAVLAVPSVPSIEKDEVSFRCALSLFVHAEQPLDRCARSALLLRVEFLHAKLRRWLHRRLRLRAWPLLTWSL